MIILMALKSVIDHQVIIFSSLYIFYLIPRTGPHSWHLYVSNTLKRCLPDLFTRKPATAASIVNKDGGSAICRSRHVAVAANTEASAHTMKARTI